MMNVLVTGGAGMIGSHIVRGLHSAGDAVTVYDDMSAYPFDQCEEYGINYLAGLSGPGIVPVEVTRASVLDRTALQLAMGGKDLVIHCAAFADVGACVREYRRDFSDNVVGTQNVLEAAKEAGVGKVLFVSSASVYGNSDEGTFAEWMTPRPISTYANSKLWGEHQAHLFYQLYGLRTTSVRLFSVYGDGQVPKPGSHSWCFAIFGMRAMRGLPITIFGDGSQVRDFTHVDDIAHGIILAAKSDRTNGQIINIGTGKSTTLNEVKDLVLAHFPRVPVKYAPLPSGDPLGGHASKTLMKRVLDWEPQVRLDDGVERYAAWVREHKHLIPGWLA